MKIGDIVEMEYKGSGNPVTYIARIDRWRIEGPGFYGPYYTEGGGHLQREGLFFLEHLNRIGLGIDTAGLLQDPITIHLADGDVVCEFKIGGVQVGCTFVPTEKVKKIYERLVKQ